MHNKTLEEINRVHIRSVLDKLGIKYSGDSIRESDQTTSGWKIYTRGNYITDFSWKERAMGWPFAVVKNHLKLSAKETFAWFENQFNIKDELIKNKWSPKQKKNKVMRPYSRKRLTE